MSIETVAGATVAVVVALYMRSVLLNEHRDSPEWHVGTLIAGSAIAAPLVLQTSSCWYSTPLQLMMATAIIPLDWLSFHEDKSRFSEENKCITGPCRRNAQITGHLAHWGDVLTLAMLLTSRMKGKAFVATVLGHIAYGIVGSVFIHEITRDGSASDLRGLTDKQKCEKARIMRDAWRGGLNDMITVMGVLTAWQTVYTSCENDDCVGVRGHLKAHFGGSYSSGVVKAVLLALPTYSNYVNTVSQHGRLRANEYDLPDCLD